MHLHDMMSRMFAVLACLAASTLVASCGENKTTVGGQLEQGGSKAFVYNPVLQGLNGTQVRALQSSSILRTSEHQYILGPLSPTISGHWLGF